MTTTDTRRRQNRWGEGELLRDEIVAAARRLLERDGTETAVSLRGVAREAGITAPSIYPHFNDRDRLIEAVIASVFDDWLAVVRQAVDALRENPSARDRLRATCLASITFAHQRPASNRILWTRPNPSPMPQVRKAATDVHIELLNTIAEAAPHLTSTQVRSRGQLLWAATYGLGALPPHHPRFPWLDCEDLVDELLDLYLVPQSL